MDISWTVDENWQLVQHDSVNPLGQAYIFLFAIQVILLTMKLLSLFANTKYLGTLV